LLSAYRGEEGRYDCRVVLAQNNSARICRGASMICMKSHLAEISNSPREALSQTMGGKELERTHGSQGERVPELGSSLTRCLEELKMKLPIDIEAVTPWT
jgi:hypothetical protein